MSKGGEIRIQFISEGFRQILLSGGTQDLVQTTADEIKARADSAAPDSEGFEAHTWQGGYGGGRWIGSVTTTDRASRLAEAEHNALSGAV